MSIRQIVEEGLLIQQPELTYDQRTERVAKALEEVAVPGDAWIGTRTSFPAASASASPLPAPWCWSRSS
jgi:ABC-type microcin C transport system duplicated ATPase subunit YejF